MKVKAMDEWERRARVAEEQVKGLCAVISVMLMMQPKWPINDILHPKFLKQEEADASAERACRVTREDAERRVAQSERSEGCTPDMSRDDM